MAYESDVRRQARLLRESAQRAQSERKKMSVCVNGVRQWWKGQGGEAFVREYAEIDREAVKSMHYLEQAFDKMNRLPSLIARAEEERRRKAEEKVLAKTREEYKHGRQN